jgi:7tm Chemosensory receptor
MTFYCVVVLGIFVRYKIINRHLKLTEIDVECLRVLSKLRIILADLIAHVNELFTFVLILKIGDATMNSTFANYEVYNILIERQVTLPTITQTVRLNIWIIYALFTVFSVTIACNLTCNEGRRTDEALKDILMKCDVDGRVRRRIRMLVQQIYHEDVKFSCKLFDINWNLPVMVSISIFMLFFIKKIIFFQFFSTILTCLIILIQFDISSKHGKLN